MSVFNYLTTPPERRKSQNFEFQALRYAANHRTLNAEKIIKVYSRYLKSIDPNPSEEKDYEEIARVNICNHLSDADNDITNISNEQLSDYIDPSRWQKIYLVASDFEPDCLSACAWLREHEIDIHCLKLQPFSINNGYILIQQRLIPTIELESYYVETRDADDRSVSQTKSARRKRTESIKPRTINWDEETFNCTKWTSLLQQVVIRALSAGVSPEHINAKYAVTEEEAGKWESWRKPTQIDYMQDDIAKKIFIDTHGSSGQLKTTMTVLIDQMHPRPNVTIELEDGSTESL